MRRIPRNLAGLGAVAVIALAVVAIAGHKPGTAMTAASDTPMKTTTTGVAPTTTSTTVPIAPLTGMPQPNAALRDRPAVTVKIDNAPQARPQFGIENADVIYEEKVEGGLSRWMAIFQSEDSDHVGPVRSLRSTDSYVLNPVGGLVAFSGGIAPFEALLPQNGLVDVDAAKYPNDYGRDPTRPYVHSMYTSTTQLRTLTPPNTRGPQPLFSYLSPGQQFAPAGAQPVTSISVTLGAESTFDWTWDPTSGLFKRGSDGAPHNLTTGQLAERNVIVQFVQYQSTPYTDAAHNPVDEAVTTGSGDAWVLSDGMLVQGHWTRPSVTAPAVYTDTAGNVIKLQPGQTFVSLVPVGNQTQIRP